jgi:hypothetical protein
MKNRRGAINATHLTPMDISRPVTRAKTMTVVQKRLQMIAAMKDARKNHLMRVPQADFITLSSLMMN